MAIDDNKIVQLYFDRDENAVNATAEKYGNYCNSIAINILGNKEDAEECVSDTYFKTWNSIPPNRPSVLKSFLGKITRNVAFSGLEVTLVNTMRREYILKEYITSVRNLYDYILIDCNSSLGMVTMNALTAADSVIIPIEAAYLSVKGLQQLITTLGRTKKYLNPNLGIEGIVFTKMVGRTNYAKEIKSMVEEIYGKNVRVFGAVIPHSVRAAETSAEGVSIFKHDPRGKVAAAYKKLAKEVLADE